MLTLSRTQSKCKSKLLDISYFTAFMLACQNNHSSTAKLLLEHKVDVHATTDKLITALVYAVDRGHDKIVNFCLENHANIDAATNNGRTSLILADIFCFFLVFHYLLLYLV